jgi:hypothetical protein
VDTDLERGEEDESILLEEDIFKLLSLRMGLVLCLELGGGEGDGDSAPLSSE